MSSNTDLTALIERMQAHVDGEAGRLSPAERAQLLARFVSGVGATGFLVVPGTLTKEEWEATGADEDAIAAMRESLQAWCTAMGLDFKPERTKETEPPSPTSQSFRKAPDKKPPRKFRSLAKRLLRR